MQPTARRAVQTALIIAALIALPSAARADGSDSGLRAALSERTREKGLTGSDAANIFARIDHIERSGLPVAPVVDRYLQGMAKDVPLPRIEAVVDELVGRLVASASEVDRAYPPGKSPANPAARLSLIEDGAFALGSGAKPEVLRAAMKLATDERLGVTEARSPVVALGCLTASRVDDRHSYDLVRAAWTHGFRGDVLEQLGRDVGSLASRDDAPVDVVETVRNAIEHGAGRDRIFAELDRLAGSESRGKGSGGGSPGVSPGENTHGPGGPPEDPGSMGNDRRRHTKPDKGSGGGGRGGHAGGRQAS